MRGKNAALYRVGMTSVLIPVLIPVSIPARIGQGLRRMRRAVSGQGALWRYLSLVP